MMDAGCRWKGAHAEATRAIAYHCEPHVRFNLALACAAGPIWPKFMARRVARLRGAATLPCQRVYLVNTRRFGS